MIVKPGVVSLYVEKRGKWPGLFLFEEVGNFSSKNVV